MRKKRKISTILIAVCFMMLTPFIQAYAAEGTLQFSDPTAKTGEEVTVTAKITSPGGAIGDGMATVAYDPAKLEFVSGTNASGTNGTVTLSATGNGTETELNFTMVFKALSEGSATLTVAESTAYLYSDEVLNLQAGGSTVMIEPGDGNAAGQTGSAASGDGAQVDIKGTTYTMNEEFTEALIPAGFSSATLNLDGTERKCIVQDSSGKNLFFFTDAQDQDVMAFYNSEDGSFTLTEQVNATDTFSLFLLEGGDGNKLPSQYKETKMTIANKDFPAWHNTEQPDFYLMYALNSEGKEGFYQYDDVDKTYQRYTVPQQSESQKANTLLDKVQKIIDENLIMIMCIAWGIFLVMLIVIIVLSTKLHNRNQELDDLYDNEYDDGESEGIRVNAGKRSQFVGFEDDADEYEDNQYTDQNEDDYDDEYDDEYEDDDEYYDDDDYDDKKNDFSINFVDLDK